MNDKIMIIDHSALCHAVKFSLGKYKLSHNEKPTFVIYGYLQMLQFLFKRVYPDRVVIACDSKKSKRKKKYPLYKENRNNKTQEQEQLDSIAYPQFLILKEHILPDIGFKNIFEVKGLEADDVIASICKSNPNSDIVIVSRDKDLYQLLTENVAIFDPTNKSYFTIKDFKKLYGITPDRWAEVKEIAGCTTDNVKGIEGVAEKTAIKYLLGKLPQKYISYKNIVKGEKIIKRNRKLVLLPYKGTPTFDVIPNRLSKKAFEKIAKAYGFKSITKDIDYWIKTLKLR